MTAHDPNRFVTALCALLLLLGGACKKSAGPSTSQASGQQGPFEVVDMEMGKSLKSDNSVTEPTLVFGKNDAFYFSVLSKGAGKVAYRLQGSFQDGSLFVDESRIVNLEGPAATEFHVVKPVGGWRVGGYQVRLSVNGETSLTRDYEVR